MLDGNSYLVIDKSVQCDNAQDAARLAIHRVLAVALLVFFIAGMFINVIHFIQYDRIWHCSTEISRF